MYQAKSIGISIENVFNRVSVYVQLLTNDTLATTRFCFAEQSKRPFSDCIIIIYMYVFMWKNANAHTHTVISLHCTLACVWIGKGLFYHTNLPHQMIFVCKKKSWIILIGCFSREIYVSVYQLIEQ